MLATIHTAAINGLDALHVFLEVSSTKGEGFHMVGLPDSAVRESGLRVFSALHNSGYHFFSGHTTINFAPADVRKEGSGYDLPLALGLMAASKMLPPTDWSRWMFVGELGLDGSVRPVRGMLPVAIMAREMGYEALIVPMENAHEAAVVNRLKVYGANHLNEVVNFIQGGDQLQRIEVDTRAEFAQAQSLHYPDFADVKGQENVKRAFEVAAAGGHNIIAIGAPGCGKTMSMQKFPGLLPLLTTEQAQPVTRILSIAGLLPPGKPAVRTPPFRMPHQTASIEGICGGGPNCRPGEISLAHNGVLFLDEAAEFKSSVLQMLRVPLENGRITISRAGRSTVFPADFQLLMAANPCPCGNYGSETKLCLCSAHSVELYWRKFSAPLLDRIDIRISVNDEKQEEAEYSASTAELRKEVAKAVMIQNKRQGKKNARLTPSEIAQFCKISEESQKILENAIERYGFSSRANASCLKLSRTIADMAGSQEILPEHLKEAIEMRKTYANLLESA